MKNLLYIKDKIHKAELEEQRLKGQLKHLKDELKKLIGTNKVSRAKKILKDKRKKFSIDKKKLEQCINELEEKIK